MSTIFTAIVVLPFSLLWGLWTIYIASKRRKLARQKVRSTLGPSGALVRHERGSDGASREIRQRLGADCLRIENHIILSSMVTLHLVPNDIVQSYEVHEWRNAAGVLLTAHQAEWQDVMEALRTFKFRRSEVLKGGGRKSVIAQRIDTFLAERDWKEKKFATKIRVDTEERDSPTHKVDCFKGRVGLEIEWNNKDPFFDRDLNNFRLLFDLRVIEVGVIITRASSLQQIFKSLGQKVAGKYGASTTHMEKRAMGESW
jgi:hypothetical protein